MNKINREHFHELDTILWDIHTKLIPPKQAFELYERRWAYVDHNNIKNTEIALINQLTKEFGNNVFLPSTH